VILYQHHISFLCENVSFRAKKASFARSFTLLFSVNKSAVASHQLLVEAYGEVILSETMCRDWFRHFKSSDFDVEDKERAEKLKLIKDEELKALFDEDPCQTQEELAESLKVAHLHAFKSIRNDSKPRKLGITVLPNKETKEIKTDINGEYQR